MKTNIEMATAVSIYSEGICFISVCAPADMPREVVERVVNLKQPTGIASKWRVSTSKWRKDGVEVNDSMPRECEKDCTRRHWLMEC